MKITDEHTILLLNQELRASLVSFDDRYRDSVIEERGGIGIHSLTFGLNACIWEPNFAAQDKRIKLPVSSLGIMVTREQPPYPATPIKTSSFHVQDAHSQLLASASDSETPSRPWATGGAADEFGLPAIQEPSSSLESGSKPVALQAGAGREAESGMDRSRSSEHIPESLRPGPSSYTPRTSQEEERLALKSTNPFRKQHSGQSTSESVGSSTEAWGESSGRPPAPSAPPPPPPISDGM